MMARSFWRRCGLVLSGFVVACSVVETQRDGAPVGFAVPPSDVRRGCSEVLVAAAAEACRGNWLCADDRSLGLACIKGASTSTCACTVAVDEESEAGIAGAGGAPSETSMVFETEEPCTTPAELRTLAASICGIEVSP